MSTDEANDIDRSGVESELDEARKLLRAVLEHIAPIVAEFERDLPLKPTTEHPVIESIRRFLEG